MNESEKLKSIFVMASELKNLYEELNKKFGWMHIKQKREAKKIYNKLFKLVESLYNDTWTVEYIKVIYAVLYAYRRDISEFLSDCGIAVEQYLESGISFSPIYFQNRDNDISDMIILNIISNDIIITIFNTKNGSHDEILSANTPSDTQNLYINICKNNFVEMIKKYINSIKNK